MQPGQEEPGAEIEDESGKEKRGIRTPRGEPPQGEEETRRPETIEGGKHPNTPTGTGQGEDGARIQGAEKGGSDSTRERRKAGKQEEAGGKDGTSGEEREKQGSDPEDRPRRRRRREEEPSRKAENRF